MTGLRFAVVLLAVVAGSALAQSKGQVTTSLTVKGSVEREITLSIDDLKSLPVQRVDDIRTVTETSGATAPAEVTSHYVGCLLRDVLERAKPVEKGRFGFRKSVVIATASDGYRAIFSWSELYLSPIGDGVLVIYERDGASLADDEGKIALVSLRDTKPGPRHVKWLQSVDLRTLND
jgi:DMSO/TMAO reductase YedYZ molybdopterin-dependent catalytic subunit